MIFKGKTIKYGNNIDTDLIIPARYLNSSDPGELALHCMEDLDTSFASRVEPGNILVAGSNFGCGSSREHAPIALKASGIACIVAVSFARIFFRNAVNTGLPILECRQASEEASEEDILNIDCSSGLIWNLSKQTSYTAIAFPPFIQDILDQGGLIPSLKKSMVENYPERT